MLFCFIEYLLSVQADGWLSSPETTPAAATWTPPCKLPSSPPPSLLCHCKLWSAVESHQVGQLEDKRQRKKATSDLFLFDRAEKNKQDAESLSGCTCTEFTDTNGWMGIIVSQCSAHMFMLTAVPQDLKMKEKYNYGCFLQITCSFSLNILWSGD